MRSLSERIANVRCINCDGRFDLGYARQLLWRNRVLAEAMKPFWRMGPLYVKPEKEGIRCYGCLMEQRLRTNRMWLIEAVFWVGGSALSIAVIWALLVFFPPQGTPLSVGLGPYGLAESVEQSLRGQGPRSNGFVWLMLIWISALPLCFLLARLLSFRLIALEPAPGTYRAPSFEGLE